MEIFVMLCLGLVMIAAAALLISICVDVVTTTIKRFQ
jgi:hypothetical protein